MQIVQLESPPAEECGHVAAGEHEPPLGLVEPKSEKRLIAPLREAARTRDAHEILVRAVAYSIRAGGDPRGAELSRALADLAATGSQSARHLMLAPLRAGELASMVARRLHMHADAPALRTHAALALERASLVARYLARGPWDRAQLARTHPQLGAWIAVSGEDDAPIVPVNASVSRHPQRSARVVVGDHALRVRYGAAGTLDGSAPLVVLLHGHSSKLEELDRLTSALVALRQPDGRPRYGVLVPDLPVSGYTSRLDHEAIAPADAYGTPLLEFHDRFVEAFVRTVCAELDLPARVACVAGGSLGGNIVLRLAEQRPAWAARFAAWSPASVWGSLRGDLLKGIALRYLRERMCDSESERSRRTYFRAVFASRICLTGRTQPEMWYRDGFRCRPRHIHRIMRERREVYGREYRRWHWRLAYEQLVFSHVEPERGAPPFGQIDAPVLLLAGANDNFRWTHVHDRTRDLAAKLAERNVRGACLLLADTGHAIHDERPRLLAAALDRFITRY